MDTHAQLLRMEHARKCCDAIDAARAFIAVLDAVVKLGEAVPGTDDSAEAMGVAVTALLRDAVARMPGLKAALRSLEEKEG